MSDDKQYEWAVEYSYNYTGDSKSPWKPHRQGVRNEEEAHEILATWPLYSHMREVRIVRREVGEWEEWKPTSSPTGRCVVCGETTNEKVGSVSMHHYHLKAEEPNNDEQETVSE